MRLIQIRYRPVKWLPFSLSVTRLSPSRWEDLSKEQMEAYEELARHRLTEDEFIIAFFGLSKKLVSRFTGFEKYNLLNTLDFISDAQGYVKHCCKHSRSIRLLPEQIRSPICVIVKQNETLKPGK